MAKTFRVEVVLDDDDIKLINAIREDGWYDAESFHDVLRSMLYLQIREDRESAESEGII